MITPPKSGLKPPGKPGLKKPGKPSLKAASAPTHRAVRQAEPPAYPATPPQAEGPATCPSPRQADQLVEVVEMLCALFETENTALRAHNIAGVRELATRKEKLTRLYIELMMSIARQADVLKTLEEERRAHLKTLEANLDACNRMIRVVVNAVKEKR
ncbi:MAG: hypothetical protein FD149_2035 [Rhodospirillaceae bacterium]|nr:MAG: hypothetical protein FD149_2035 [Rhodospirillaceae bacterium]